MINGLNAQDGDSFILVSFDGELASVTDDTSTWSCTINGTPATTVGLIQNDPTSVFLTITETLNSADELVIGCTDGFQLTFVDAQPLAVPENVPTTVI